MSGSVSSKAVPPSQEKSFFRRIDIRFPWLKLVAIIIVGILATIDLLDLTITRTGDPVSRIRVAPMARHVRATERILEGRKLIALTFDDGPSNATTPHLLDILYEKDVPVTFFMLGKMARNNPDLVKRAESEGHIVASHTMYHQNLVRISAPAVQSDIDEAKAIFSDILGHTPILTRPPYGNFNNNVAKSADTPLILWSVDTRDWENRDPNLIINNAIAQSYDGAIILMHDIYPTSVDAVSNLIDTMRSNGYEFVTIPEFAEIRGITLLAGNAYYNFRP